MSGMHAASGSEGFLDALVLSLAALAVAVYAAAAFSPRRRGGVWPVARTLAWVGGILLAVAAVTGPLGHTTDFRWHMGAHLLVGMAAPLLLVAGRPVTLALQTLALTPARRLSRVLRSAPVRVVSWPPVVAVLSAGGLWLAYLTPVWELMRSDPLVHLAVSAHMLAAGYLLAAIAIGPDPQPHRSPRGLVAASLLVTFVAHSVVAKSLYASPPAGVPSLEAEHGAQLMYYAGGALEGLLVLLFCLRWYRATAPRAPQPVATSSAKRIAAEP